MAINLYIFGTEILCRSSRKVHKPKWERWAHAWCDVRRFINFDPESNIAKCYQILRPLIVCSVNTVSCFFIWCYVINCCLTEQRHTKRLNHLNVLGENQEIYLYSSGRVHANWCIFINILNLFEKSTLCSFLHIHKHVYKCTYDIVYWV